MRAFIASFFTLLFLFSLPSLSFALEVDINISDTFTGGFVGETLSPLWSLPFVGIILSIAFFPLINIRIWGNHYGKITIGWVLLFFIPLIAFYGVMTALSVLVNALFTEFIPFILLLFVLFAASGGINISGNLQGTPKVNLTLMAIGTGLASLMGTTGAAMLLIRPLLQANRNRKHKVHLAIFFIFLVANVGGGLTPLGDPPLFLGFLYGVDFFWTLKWMLGPVLVVSSILLTLFFILDSYLYKKEGLKPSGEKTTVTIGGKRNFFIILGVLIGIITSGFWDSGITVTILDTTLTLQGICRDLLFIILALISMRITPKAILEKNNFNWLPIIEVAKLFLGIFLTIVPVIMILQAGENGAFYKIVEITHDTEGNPINALYFWVTTLLSAFLDNAPTYLVFFNLAAGEGSHLMDAAQYLMHDIPGTLLAISMGTVFTGPLTYIGNAPNFMIKSLAESEGITMPSFFGYFFRAAIVFVPIYFIVIYLFL